MEYAHIYNLIIRITLNIVQFSIKINWSSKGDSALKMLLILLFLKILLGDVVYCTVT